MFYCQNCVMCHCVITKNIKALFRFARWRRSAIKDCRKLKIWTLRQSLGTNRPNLIKIGQKVAGIWWLNGFQNGICPPSWIFEIQFLTVWEVKRPVFHHHTKLRKDRSHCCGDIAIFMIFKMVAAAMLDFYKFDIFTDNRSPVGGQYVSLYQISS